MPQEILLRIKIFNSWRVLLRFYANGLNDEMRSVERFLYSTILNDEGIRRSWMSHKVTWIMSKPLEKSTDNF